MDPTTNADYQWLLSDAAIGLLAQTQTAFRDHLNPVRVVKNLRRLTTVTRSALLMDQAQLRIRAKSKFALADRMFFTRRSLEQSTGGDLARYKAVRFDGIESVADLCCGIGGDLLELIQRQSAQHTVGLDADPLTVLFAQHNAGLVTGTEGTNDATANVHVGQFSDFDVSPFDGIHCDPDRRAHQRTTVGSRFSPPLEEVLHRVGVSKNLGIKVAPATRVPPDLIPGIEREWIGDRRECKQQVIWRGPRFERPDHRTATCVDGDQFHQISVHESEMENTIEVAGKMRRYLFEPHPAVLAAGLTDVLAAQCGVARMALEVDYLTSAKSAAHPLLTQFEVVEAFPLDLRRTVDYLKKHDVGLVEVKKRGVGKVLFDQFERMKIKGPHRATIILTRIGPQRLVAIARRSPEDFPL